MTCLLIYGKQAPSQEPYAKLKIRVYVVVVNLAEIYLKFLSILC